MAKLTLNLQATPATPAANFVELFYSSSFTPPALAAVDESGNIVRVGGFTTQDYRLVKVTHVTATGTYTPTSGVRALFVEAWGGGGGGGGCATAVTNSAAAGGGGGGAYSAAWLTTLVSGNHTVTIGGGGAGGTAGANPGTAGTDTDFKDTGGTTRVYADGGAGGAADTVATIHTGGLGGAGGLASAGTGDVKQDGAPGDAGLALAAAQCLSGAGGVGFMNGGNAIGKKNATGAGGSATGYGGGGSGATIISGGASQAGGNGGAGIVRVWEFA